MGVVWKTRAVMGALHREENESDDPDAPSPDPAGSRFNEQIDPQTWEQIRTHRRIPREVVRFVEQTSYIPPTWRDLYRALQAKASVMARIYWNSTPIDLGDGFGDFDFDFDFDFDGDGD